MNKKKIKTFDEAVLAEELKRKPSLRLRLHYVLGKKDFVRGPIINLYPAGNKNSTALGYNYLRKKYLVDMARFFNKAVKKDLDVKVTLWEEKNQSDWKDL